MIFTDNIFLVFYAVVLSIYWLLGHKSQNIFLLVASYIFYGSWDWSLLSVLVAITAATYTFAILVHRHRSNRRVKHLLFAGAVLVNLSFLGYFKYMGFLVTEFTELLVSLGIRAEPKVLSIILPLGISFYCFQTLGYVIDVAKGSVKPVTSILEYSLYTAFFPQLIAGPIERAKNLLPQFASPRQFNYQNIRDGLFLIVLGMLLKLVVADRIGTTIQPIFAPTWQTWKFGGFEHFSAPFLFLFQIYYDFFAYSTIARGLGKTLGFELSVNFKRPLASTNPAEFWQRWHITLSFWVRDYLFLPLLTKLSRITKSASAVYTAQFLSILIIGIWHGANWTFLWFGVVWGTAVVLSKFFERTVTAIRNRHNSPLLAWWQDNSNTIPRILKWAITFNVAVFGALIFRAPDMGFLGKYFNNLWTMEYDIHSMLDSYGPMNCLLIALGITTTELLVYYEDKIDLRNRIFGFGLTRRWLVYGSAIVCLILLGRFDSAGFIYFQF